MGQQIVITGDRDSGLDIVEGLLHSCGMARPLRGGSTRRTPQEVIRGLESALPHGACSQASDIVSPQAGAAAWQALAADAMLANLEQPLWGWADAGAVRWLPLWQAIDPTARFVLVYDSPESVLQHPDGAMWPDALRAALRRWQTANEALLDFQLRHPERCILMNVAQACRAVGAWARLMKRRIPAAWASEINRLADFGTTLEREACASTLDLQRHLHDDDVPAALHQQMQSEHPAVWQLHEELQAAAALPLQRTAALDASAGIHEWAAWFDRGRRLRKADAVLQAARAETEALHNRGDALAADAERSARELARMSERAAQLEARCEQSSEQATEQAQEVDRLVVQLQLVQEELERMRSQAGEIEHVQAQALAQAGEHQRAHAAAEAERSELAARLGQIGMQIEEQARLADAARCEAERRLEAAQQDNARLIEQLLKVQDRLDTVPAISFAAAAASAPSSALATAAAMPLAVAPKPAAPKAVVGPLGAADRVRSYLSYRLGARMIVCSRSFGGWLTMPFQLASVALRYRRERRARDEQPARKLPPIEQYRDAHEAERLRRHLSYRLGQALIVYTTSPLRWPQLPFALHREVRQFRAKSEA